jgi:hypothetical protein
VCRYVIESVRHAVSLFSTSDNCIYSLDSVVIIDACLADDTSGAECNHTVMMTNAR